ncbi:MAG: PepSY domain-containing protein [Pseudomonadota bacterium]
MKKIISMFVLTFYCSIALSEEMTTPSSLAFILKKLDEQSYRVLKLEYEHKGYEAKVISPEGFLQEIKFDKTGNLLSTPTTHLLSMAAALELAEKAGYHEISSIKISKHNTYALEARDNNNNEIDLTIDAQTRKIKVKKEWWDVF